LTITDAKEILYTVDKVIDLIDLIQRWKDGYRGAGVGKTVIIMELINNIAKKYSGCRFSGCRGTYA